MPGEEEVRARFIEYTKTITRQNAIHDERMLAAFFGASRLGIHGTQRESKAPINFIFLAIRVEQSK